MAASHLESLGYRIIDTNWRCRAGEIDIVARGGSRLSFFEVKYRSSGVYGSGEEAITQAKARRLQRLALAYLQANPSLSCSAVTLELISVVPAGKDFEFRITPII